MGRLELDVVIAGAAVAGAAAALALARRLATLRVTMQEELPALRAMAAGG